MTSTSLEWGGWGPDVRDNPFPLLARLRSTGPVHEVRLADGHDAWLVLGHDQARHALSDRRLSKDMLAALQGSPDVVAEGLPGPAFSRHMLNVDPPDHTRLRKLVARAFAPARVAALEPAIKQLANGLLDDLEGAAPGQGVDLVAGYARPLPFAVIGELLGIPVADRATLIGWFMTLLQPCPREPTREMVAASEAIVGYLTHLVDAKCHTPGDDLVTVLVSASHDGDQLNRQEILSSLFQLVVAGHDTTTSLIGNAVVALLDHPDQLEALADPGLLPGAIEELLRYCAPVPHATFRMTTQAVDLDGSSIPAGKQVLVCLAAANRDPSRWPGPDRLDLRRAHQPHLAFGHGIHFCLGAALARLEAAIGLGTLLGRFPKLCLAVPRDDLAWSHGDGLVLRGLDSLPVTLNPHQLRRLS